MVKSAVVLASSLVCIFTLQQVWSQRFLLRQLLEDSHLSYYLQAFSLSFLAAVTVLLLFKTLFHLGKELWKERVSCKRVSLEEYERLGKEVTEKELKKLRESREFKDFKRKVETMEMRSAWEDPDELYEVED